MSQQILKDYSYLEVIGDSSIFWEKRMENNVGGNPIYVGYNRNANAPTSSPTWFIINVEYSGTSPIRYRLPDDGPQFKYAWDDRATLFAP